MQWESWSRKPHNFSQHLFTFPRNLKVDHSYLAIRPTGGLLLLPLKLHPFMAPDRGKVELEWETFTQLHHNMWILVTNLEQEITLKLLKHFGNEPCLYGICLLGMMTFLLSLCWKQLKYIWSYKDTLASHLNVITALRLVLLPSNHPLGKRPWLGQPQLISTHSGWAPDHSLSVSHVLDTGEQIE